MSGVIEIAAEGERRGTGASAGFPRRIRRGTDRPAIEYLPAHQFPAKAAHKPADRDEQCAALVRKEGPSTASQLREDNAGNGPNVQSREMEEEDRERERRIYRGRTVTMLRRYLRYSIETGRMPSLLGAEFFRAKVTAYRVVTFEDRVIFVHDMEKCLDKLDDFSRQLIARHILQEHDRTGTAKLLRCNEKTVRRYTPVVLDLLSEILLDVGLMERVDGIGNNSCQEGRSGPFDVSDCEDEE